MQAVSPGLVVRPLHGNRFRTEQSAAILPRTALFSLDSFNLSAARSAAGDLWSITIPLRGGFDAAIGGRARSRRFDRNTAYLLHPDRDFKYRAPGASRVLVVNVLSPDLTQRATTLVGERMAELTEEISLARPSGRAVTRFVHYLWSELQHPGGLWDCPTALAEMEDSLVSLLVMAGAAREEETGPTARLSVLRSAENFLMQHLTVPVTRAELARTAGVSIRTISRAFHEHHGLGPMAWLRARRLEAAQNELRSASRGELTVTEVAMRYGFWNSGRFAVTYRAAFGESPLETLRSRSLVETVNCR